MLVVREGTTHPFPDHAVLVACHRLVARDGIDLVLLGYGDGTTAPPPGLLMYAVSPRGVLTLQTYGVPVVHPVDALIQTLSEMDELRVRMWEPSLTDAATQQKMQDQPACTVHTVALCAVLALITVVFALLTTDSIRAVPPDQLTSWLHRRPAAAPARGRRTR